MNTAEIAFEHDPKHRKDYWQITVEGETLLVPRPSTPHEFAELEPVFRGQASPRTLRRIRPARIRPEGAIWRLERAGEVEAANG